MRGGRAGLPPHRLAGLAKRLLAEAADEQGAHDAVAWQRLAGSRRGEALELLERLPHPAGREMALAHLVEEEEDRLLAQDLLHAGAQGVELLRRQARPGHRELDRSVDHP